MWKVLWLLAPVFHNHVIQLHILNSCLSDDLLMLKCNTRHMYHESLSHMVHLHPGKKSADDVVSCPALHPRLLYQHLPLKLLQEERRVKKETSLH